MFFEDRAEAGQLLAAALSDRVQGSVPIVLGLSYGGIVVADSVARSLGAELDAFIVPPVGGGRDVFRARRAPLEGRFVVVVDDGAATGETVRRAVEAVRRHAPLRLVVALPVAPSFTAAKLEALADDVVCLQCPAQFLAVAACYGRFPEVTASEAVRALRLPRREPQPAPPSGACPAMSLATAMRDGCEALRRGLDAFEAALAGGTLDHARGLFASWRELAARHLAWEEASVLPEYERACGDTVSQVLADHAALHRSLLAVAADLSDELSRAVTAPSCAAQDLTRSLKRKFVLHADSELQGLGGVLGDGTQIATL